MKKALFILGAPDDEMDAIQEILEALHIAYMLALDEHGKRISLRSADKVAISTSVIVHGGQDRVDEKWRSNDYTHIFWVECIPLQLHQQWIINNCEKQYYLNHHRPGDAGYNLPPEQYWSASALGQVINVIRCPPRGLQITPKTMLDINVITQPRAWLLEHIAAADHCLRDAYRGRCPGISPVSLRMWRLMSSSKQRNLSIDFCVKEQQQQVDEILALPNFCIGKCPDTVSELETYQIKDTTGIAIHNAPELAYILDMAIMFRRRNFICIVNADPWVVDLWVERYARDTLNDIYVDRVGGTANGKIK